MNIQSLSATRLTLDRTGNSFSVDAIEKRLGVELPNALQKVLTEFEGGPIIFGDTAGIVPSELPTMATGEMIEVATIYGLNDGDFGLLKMQESYAGRIQESYIPIAEGWPGDNYLLNTITGEVVYWHHECQDGEMSSTAMTLVAESMEKFLASIERVSTTGNNAEPINVTPGAFDFLLGDKQ